MRHFLLLISVILFSSSAIADAPKDLGPDIGTMMPMAIDNVDQHGTRQSLKSLSGTKGLVLVFYRSAGWCPYCQMQLIDLQINGVKQIRNKGYDLAAISYDSLETLKRFNDKWSINYPLLSDEGSKLIKAFGLQNMEYKKRSRAWGVPYPMVMVISPEGKIIKKLHEASYMKRPPVSEILQALD